MPVRSFQGCASLLHFVARQTTCRHVWDWKQLPAKQLLSSTRTATSTISIICMKATQLKHLPANQLSSSTGLATSTISTISTMHETWDTMRNQPRVNSDKNGLHSCLPFCPDGWENALIIVLVFLVQKLTIVIIVSLTWASSRSLGLNLSLSRVSFKT